MQATVFQLDDRINAYIAHRQEQGAANATIKHFEYLINLTEAGKNGGRRNHAWEKRICCDSHRRVFWGDTIDIQQSSHVSIFH